MAYELFCLRLKHIEILEGQLNGRARGGEGALELVHKGCSRALANAAARRTSIQSCEARLGTCGRLRFYIVTNKARQE